MPRGVPNPQQVNLGAGVHVMVDVLGGEMADMLGVVTSSTSRQLVALAEVFGAGAAPAERQAMFEAVGRLAQRSVLASYDQTVTRRKGPAGLVPYQRVKPQNVRLAGGKLRAALKDPDFYTATPNGLDFINVDLLNKRARHWARLNAGAGRSGSGSKRQFEMRFSNIVFDAIGVDMDARPAFSMPRGFWFNRAEGALVRAGANPNGSDEFYPIGEGPARVANPEDAGSPRGRPGLSRRGSPTRGIKARNFLDAGAARIAKELPPRLETLYANLYKQGVIASKRAAGPSTVVVGPRPRRGTPGVSYGSKAYRRGYGSP